MNNRKKVSLFTAAGFIFLALLTFAVVKLPDLMLEWQPPTATAPIITPATPWYSTPEPIPARTLDPVPTETSEQVFYVAPGGDDSNPGTLDEPWKTIQKAADTLIAGDTVLIREGLYHENFRVEPQNSGTPDAYIVYKAYPGEHPDIHTNGPQGFFIAKKAYIEINGLTVTAEDAPFTTESCGTGIFAEHSHHIQVLNNIVRGSGGSGITFETGSDYALVQGNVVYDNGWGCSSWRGSAINFHRIMWYDQAEGIHNIVRNNLVYHNYHNPTYVLKHTDGNAFTVDEANDVNSSGTNPPVLFENNIAFDNAGPCLNVFHSSNTIFRNNTCYQNVSDKQESGADEITITQSSAVQVYNNILVPRSGRAASSQYKSSDLFFDCNLAFGGKLLVHGKHDINADPKFIYGSLDPTLADFHLQPDSPAIDMALSTQSPAVDYDGVSRPQGAGFDIGAYEYK